MSDFDATTTAADLRQKVLNGEEITPEEYNKALETIRKARRSDSAAKKSKKASAPSKPMPENLDDLFNSTTQ